MKQWFALATQASVVRRAMLYAVIVGPVLVCINHGNEFLRGQFSASMAVKIILTMMVPYLVSTFSSVGAMRN